MHKSFSRVLLDLYRGSRRIEPEGFQQWVFETLNEVVSIDAGMWISGVQKSDLPPMHSHFLYQLPATLIADYLTIWKDDPLHQRLESASGIAANLTRADYVKAPAARAFIDKYDIASVLATRIVDPISNLRTVIAISRSSGRVGFTESERQLMEDLTPHLIEVWTANRLTYALKRNDLSSSPATGTATGVVDRSGVLHVAEDYFGELLRQEWPEWSGPYLPDSLRTRLLRNGLGFVGKHVVVALVGTLHDQYLLRARRKVGYDTLGEREQEIARLVAEGLSQKEIARKCNISPATVNNHLARIYQKLGIGDKAQLTRVISKLE